MFGDAAEHVGAYLHVIVKSPCVRVALIWVDELNVR
jgi:hypothetical protein